MPAVANVCLYAGNPPAANAQPLFGPAQGDKTTNQYTLDIPVAIAANLVAAPAAATYSLSIGLIGPRNPASPATLHSIAQAANGTQRCVFTA